MNLKIIIQERKLDVNFGGKIMNKKLIFLLFLLFQDLSQINKNIRAMYKQEKQFSEKEI